MQVLIDTNIILDVLLNREPFVQNAVKILKIPESKVYKFVSASSITDIYYSSDFIGLDCGVFREPMGGYYHPQNVLVIDDKDFSSCYNQYGQKLEFVKPVPRIETVTEGEKDE